MYPLPHIVFVCCVFEIHIFSTYIFCRFNPFQTVACFLILLTKFFTDMFLILMDSNKSTFSFTDNPFLKLWTCHGFESWVLQFCKGNPSHSETHLSNAPVPALQLSVTFHLELIYSFIYLQIHLYKMEI